jgi:hypothetical protein
MGTFLKGSPPMSREDELASVREQVSILAEQVARLMDIISNRSGKGWNVEPYEEKLVLTETLMWKLHRRQMRLARPPIGATHMRAAR